MSAKANKILVIRFSSIGDIVLTSPVVRGLKEQVGAEVHFLTKSAFAPIVNSNPYIDRVFVIRKKVSEVLPALKKEQYDYIIDLHKNLRSLQVKLALKVKTTTFDKLNFEKWLMTNFKINKLPKIHIVDRYLRAVAFLGVKKDHKGLDYFIPKEEEVDLTAFELIAGKFVVFVIGAAHLTKCLPIEKMVEMCNGIALPVTLIGGADDAAKGNEIVKLSANKNISNHCGQLSLHQSASLVRQSSLVISHDTGMMHIAAAFHKPIISVWGNTIPEFGMYPYYPQEMDKNISIEVEGLSCRPCSKIGYGVCPKGHFKCMRDQNVDKILDAMRNKPN